VESLCARVALLDFDGTVVDTMNIYAVWVAENAKKCVGVAPEEAKKLYLQTAGMPFKEQLLLMGATEDCADFLTEDFVKFKKELLKKITLNACVKMFIEGLRSQQVVTALSTNNECESLKDSPLILEFHLVLCYDGKGHKKGRPHLETLKRIFGDTASVVFIGDTDYDIRTYSQLGIPSIKTAGLFNCDEARRVFSEVQRVFESLNA